MTLIWKKFKHSPCKRVFYEASTLRVHKEVKAQPTRDLRTHILQKNLK